MKTTHLLTLAFFISLSYSSRSQEYSYTHYDITDGLAWSVVYCITQDKDGFIWMGTETGVSRFDGTHFKNYSVADGLPDIEVLNMFGDSRGRVWMAPWRKSICYYYRGKIYNQDNDSMLYRVHLKGNIESFAEDAAGNILVQERTALHLLTAAGGTYQYDSIDGAPISKCATIGRSPTGHFFVQMDTLIYTLTSAGFKPFYTLPLFDAAPNFIAINPGGMIWRSDPYHCFIHSFRTGNTIVLPFEQQHYRHLSFSITGDSLFYFNEITGATEYNIYTGGTKRFLPGMEVSRTFRDATGNTWFTTLGQGIFRLNSDEFRTIRMKAPGMEESAVQTVRRMGNSLLVGDNHNYLFRFSLPDMVLTQTATMTGGAKNRVLDIGRLPNGFLYVASDDMMSECTPALQLRANDGLGVKSTFRKNDNEIFLGTSWGVGLFDMRKFYLTDTLWRERTTTIYYKDDTLYIGTLNGLYILAPDRSATFLGKTIPILQKRISAIDQSSDGIFWIATYDAGVIGYKDGRIVKSLSRREGLTSDLCRTILVQGNSLWIGTDKGLNKVRLDQPGYPVTQYNSNDGLGSDIINSIYADSSVIYVGTPAGLSYFDETKVNVSEGCSLHLLSITNQGRDRIGDSAHLLIPYSDKHLRLEFAGISYRSVGSIRYRYRLVGIDTGWHEIKESFLEYPTLPSGKYMFQLQAVNKFGISSAMLSLPFEVITPFWQSAWFYTFLVGAFLLLTWLFVTLRIKNIRRRQMEREELNQRLAEMEITALQAQMNPHFIFNCLNSIQQYIFDQEVLAANRYLTGFARLIRSTLHNSSKAFISLADEIDYLSTYLSLEKGRFKEKMDYTIHADPSVDTSLYIIPPMLIQPFVENSMRHGLRHKTSGKGYIHIGISMSGHRLMITVDDNGIGRKKAAHFKTREHIEYQSKGMSLTADRIRMMNVKYNDSIRVEVIDLEDALGQPGGTRVTMLFPLFHATMQKDTI